MNSSNLPAQKISDIQLKKMLESSNPPLVIDVRTPKKYAWNHIPQSKNIPIGNFEYFNQLIVDRGQLTVKEDLPFALLR